MKGPQIAGLIIGLIIIIVAIIVIVILLKKKNKSTKSQEIVIDNGKVQDFTMFSKANLKNRFDKARESIKSDPAISKAEELYGDVAPSKLERVFEENIPYDYIAEIDNFNKNVAKYFDGLKSNWTKTSYKKDNNEGVTESTETPVPKVFSYVLYDTLNGDLKKVYINPPINSKTKEKEDYDKYDTLGDFLIWHISGYGHDEVMKGDRKVDIDLNDKRLVRLSQLKNTYDDFVSSKYDNFVEYLYKNQYDIYSKDEAQARAEAIIEVLTTSPYTWVDNAMIDAWNNGDNNSIDYRKQFKHPVIYALAVNLDKI